ncbi:2-aminoadipate transaminase (plasmid) [Variovorax sp. SRS16]|uniref:aminotransferase-like domain-containing protein n=1 Tax=Variovorax sp. SRS16 TaxID=282217 RepID=UPI001316547D|nr:PLP-dependent aminotransferase family protein [Variovorax sp. SRS16]VTU45868.1 2-aminoadipate transaminase [Variovorax sp. SRS16]
MQAGDVSEQKLNLRVTRGSSLPVYRQLVDGIEAAVQEGRLRPGDALPSIRAVAAELGINQMTVSKAYRQLSNRGIVRGQSGNGTRVLEQRPGSAPIAPTRAARAPEVVDRYPSRMAELANAPGVIALTDAYPQFPAADLDAFRICLDKALSAYGTSMFAYGPPAGKFELRDLLAQVVRRADVAVQADQIVLTSGAQQALDLSARLLLRPGDVVVVESPCYFGALDVFRALGAEIVEIPISSDGISAADLRSVCERHAPKAFYTIPTVHNPTGITTSEARRLEILEVARAFGCVIIEDDYCPELHFGRDRVKSYLALSQGSVEVFYLRSLGKIYLPGIRLGFLIPPAARLPQALQLKRSSDMHGPLVLQNAAELFLRERMFDSQAMPELKSLQARARLLFAELENQLPAGCETRMVTGGLSFWVSLPESVSNEDLYFAAIRHSVAFALGSAFFAEHDGASKGIRVSFGGLTNDQIIEGVKRLCLALASVFGSGADSSAYFI